MHARRWMVVTGALASLCARVAIAAADPGPPAATAPAPVVLAPPALAPLVDDTLELIVTPSADHAPFVHAIDAATTSIDLAMFHLTDRDVVAALIRAHQRGVAVRVIVDGTGLAAKANRGAYRALVRAAIDARPSSPKFTITHEKAMVVDGALAFITAINLTRDVARTRDLGVITHAATAVADVERLFEADWRNAVSHGHDTPVLAEPSLVVSPIDSRRKLIALVASAQQELVATVENLGDAQLMAAFAAAAARGVAIRMIVPMCDKGDNPLYNLPAARELAGANVDVRLMPAPESADTPYMHSKMILVDRAVAYVGSINFSANSTSKARELGVIFANASAAAQIHAIFEADWQHVVPAATTPRCK